MVDGIHSGNQWHAVVPVSHGWAVLFPEKALWRSIGGVGKACVVFAVVPVSVLWSFAGQPEAVVLVRLLTNILALLPT